MEKNMLGQATQGKMDYKRSREEILDKNVSGKWHWKLQRIANIIMSITTIPAICFIMQNHGSNIEEAKLALLEKGNIALALILVVSTLYYCFLHIELVFEDYIKCTSFRKICINLIRVLTFLTITILVITLGRFVGWF